jgi:hypothetical protein
MKTVGRPYKSDETKGTVRVELRLTPKQAERLNTKVEQSNFPVEPSKDYTVIHSSDYRQMKEEIGNAIRILKMTDEEVVSTSTYNSVAKYL